MTKIDTHSNIKIRHTDGDDILSINPELVLLGDNYYPFNDRAIQLGSWQRQENGWEYDLFVPSSTLFSPIQVISDAFKVRLHVEYTNPLCKCGYKQIDKGKTNAWFFSNPDEYDKHRAEKVLNDLKSVLYEPLKVALPQIIQLSDKDILALKDSPPHGTKYMIVEQNGTVFMKTNPFIRFNDYLDALRVTSGLYDTDCHVWCFTDYHFRYYQFRKGQNPFKVGIKPTPTTDIPEFDFGRKRVEERWQQLTNHYRDLLDNPDEPVTSNY